MNARSFIRLGPFSTPRTIKGRSARRRQSASNFSIPTYDPQCRNAAAWQLLGFRPREVEEEESDDVDEMEVAQKMRWLVKELTELLDEINDAVDVGSGDTKGAAEIDSPQSGDVDVTPLNVDAHLKNDWKKHLDEILAVQEKGHEPSECQALPSDCMEQLEAQENRDVAMLGLHGLLASINANLDRIATMFEFDDDEEEDDVFSLPLERQAARDVLLRKQISNARYRRWIADGERNGVPLGLLLELWERTQDDGYAVVVNKGETAAVAYTVGLSVSGGFGFELIIQHISLESSEEDTRKAMAHIVRELRLLHTTQRIPPDHDLVLSAPQLRGSLSLLPLGCDATARRLRSNAPLTELFSMASLGTADSPPVALVEVVRVVEK